MKHIASILSLLFLFSCSNTDYIEYSKDPPPLDVNLHGTFGLSSILIPGNNQSILFININEDDRAFRSSYLYYGGSLELNYHYLFSKLNYREGLYSLENKSEEIDDFADSRTRYEAEIGLFYGLYAISYIRPFKDEIILDYGNPYSVTKVNGKSDGFKLYIIAKFFNVHFRYEEGTWDNGFSYNEFGIFTDLNLFWLDLI